MKFLLSYLDIILTITIVIINIISFAVMAYDKHKAVHNKNNERISEGSILFLAILFGGMGVYLAMFIFRHKTRKWYFQLGVPLLIIQNIISFHQLLNIL